MDIANWLLENGDDLQFALLIGGAVLFMALEWALPGWSAPLRRAARWPANAALTALNILVLGALPVSFISGALWAQDQGIGLLNAFVLPGAAAFVATLALRGLVSFVTHFSMHKVPLFWLVHRVHHLDTQLDLTNAARFHPLEFVIGLAMGLPIVVTLGLSPWTLALYELMDVAVNLWSHAAIRLPDGLNRMLRYVIVTPQLHRVHHSSYQPETDSNFGAVFPIWDLVFHTFRTEVRGGLDGMEIGLEEVRDRRTNDFWWLLTSPLRGDLRREQAHLVKAA